MYSNHTNSVIMHFAIYMNKLKTYVQTKILSGYLFAPLFTITKSWKDPNCPLVDEWMNSNAPIQWSIIQSPKVIYEVMKRYEGTLNTY